MWIDSIKFAVWLYIKRNKVINVQYAQKKIRTIAINLVLIDKKNAKHCFNSYKVFKNYMRFVLTHGIIPHKNMRNFNFSNIDVHFWHFIWVPRIKLVRKHAYIMHFLLNHRTVKRSQSLRMLRLNPRDKL